MNITAFTKVSTPVEGHEAIERAASEPVKVEHIDGSGARVAKGLPSGHVVIYDVMEYDETEREKFVEDGFAEIEEGVWVPTYARIVHIEQEPRLETYAVVVDDAEEAVKSE